ncbi:hypothetical protein CROQUDRAFT_528770 [Cronartium quercuum f. sp. fusiforme G11]|uniref:Uncharacterized protein n=1 Tax=Cronartium quercuum f. sp. fusiforme G11 TaxID=708437 RepID=A0A9P6NG57_9BASI|nr:hypothetical protein CROQUDRAFT_528770 [Cronartium quercuum f. sp. fusiforme G11]
MVSCMMYPYLSHTSSWSSCDIGVFQQFLKLFQSLYLVNLTHCESFVCSFQVKDQIPLSTHLPKKMTKVLNHLPVRKNKLFM